MKKSVKKGIKFFFALFLVFAVAIGFGLNFYLEHDHQKKMEENAENEIENLEDLDPNSKERVNILVLGVDYLNTKDIKSEASIRTDTIMLFSYNPKTETAFLLSIPRDSRVPVNGELDKINHAHAYGGVDLSIKTISEFLGQPIHHYVKVDYNAVTEIVDAVGGVEVDIPNDMHNDLEKIHFKKGTQTINGQQAVKYLRYRGYANADIARIGVQQDFIKRLSQKILSPGMIIQMPRFVEIMNKNIETDMSKKQLLALSNIFIKVDPSTMEKAIIPGEGHRLNGNGPSYWFVDEEQKQILLNRLFSDEVPSSETVSTENNTENTNQNNK